MEAFDAVVIGAGIVGAACARELAAGGLSVAVVEQGAVGGGATGAGMGHVAAMDGSPGELALTRYSRALWEEWVAPCDRHPCGTIWVAADEADLAEARRKGKAYEAAGAECELLDERAIAALEPALRPGLAGGLRVPGDHVVYAPAVAATWLARSGARTLHVRAAALFPGGVALADGARVFAARTVLAAGMESAALLPDLPLQPKKGHLAITARYPGFIRHQLIELGYVSSAHTAVGDSVAFNAQPRPTGQVLIGSSRQPGCGTVDVEHRILSRMLRRACAFLPDLAGRTCVRTWAGLRAATPDGLPLIGPWPERADLWVATGHEGLGIATAPGTARLLAAQLLDQVPDLPCAPYLPARFAEVKSNA